MKKEGKKSTKQSNKKNNNNKKHTPLILVAFIVFLAFGIYSDVTEIEQDTTRIARPNEGEATKIIDFELTAGDVFEKYPYEVEIQPKNAKKNSGFDLGLGDMELSKEDLLLEELERELASGNPNSDYFKLPSQIQGVSLSWKQKKNHMTLKIFVFETVVLILLVLLEKEQRKKAHQKQVLNMKMDYPGIVSNLAVLTGAGMTVRQAWNKISARYSGNRLKSHPGQEMVVLCEYEMKNGASERSVYQKIAELGQLEEYRRLSRLLTQNLEKGNKKLGALLEHESEDAFSERKRVAVKLGEEATTKMIFPLIVMLAVVMVIVIAPAAIDFMG